MRKLILLVEDNDSDEKLTVRALKKCGIEHEIIVQRDGADALDWLFATGKFAGRDVAVVPTVVLLDLNLPKIDGIDVLKRLRADERTKTLPVVMMTSSNEQEDIVRSFSCGANAYVRKPVGVAEFAEAAKAIGVFWLSLNEPAPPARDRS